MCSAERIPDVTSAASRESLIEPMNRPARALGSSMTCGLRLLLILAHLLHRQIIGSEVIVRKVISEVWGRRAT